MDKHWQAVSPDARVIHHGMNQSLFHRPQDARVAASAHAEAEFPKRLALGRWSHHAWTGGEDYREWLITLPYYPQSYFSTHYPVRNILAHVRCDVREGAGGERVLLLHEVQSDWAQATRRAVARGNVSATDERCPPFWKEWQALAMKLMLLHAAHQELDAVAWTTGAQQVQRWGPRGAAGLRELYDHTLPRDVHRLVAPFGAACELMNVYVPTNFSIKRTDEGYEVYSPENDFLGSADTLEDAREFMPDGAHEVLHEVHGVRLPKAMRGAVWLAGFAAWG